MGDVQRNGDNGGFKGDVITHDILTGTFAAVIATSTTIALLLLQRAIDLVPQFDFIGLLAMIGAGMRPVVNWAVLFGVGGILFGLGFAVLDMQLKAATGMGELKRGQPTES